MRRDFGWSLPPGVSSSDIPGNRPEDVRHDDILSRAETKLPPRLDKAYELLSIIKDPSDAEAMAAACVDFINLFEPTADEYAQARRLGVHIDRESILNRFLGAIEDAGQVAGEYMDPPEMEYEPPEFYDED